MADIKTRNIKKGTVKALDRSAVLADKTKIFTESTAKQALCMMRNKKIIK